MILREELLAEHSKKQRDRIVRYIGSDAKRFDALMQIFYTGGYRLTQRAAWPMSYCVKDHPELIKPYFKPLIEKLSTKGEHNAVTRNIIRLLQYVPVPRKYHGKLMNICFDLIKSTNTPSAIKTFSLTVLHNLSSQYPDILHEILLMIEDHQEHQTPAFTSRAAKILKKIPAAVKTGK